MSLIKFRTGNMFKVSNNLSRKMKIAHFYSSHIVNDKHRACSKTAIGWITCELKSRDHQLKQSLVDKKWKQLCGQLIKSLSPYDLMQITLVYITIMKFPTFFFPIDLAS